MKGNESTAPLKAFANFFSFKTQRTLKNQLNNQGIGSFKTVPNTRAYRSRAAGSRVVEFVLTTRNAE